MNMEQLEIGAFGTDLKMLSEEVGFEEIAFIIARRALINTAMAANDTLNESTDLDELEAITAAMSDPDQIAAGAQTIATVILRDEFMDLVNACIANYASEFVAE